MKEIEKLAERAWNGEFGYDTEGFEEDDYKPAFTDGFIQCYNLIQRWIPIEEKLPICSETGNWDGKRSDYVLVKFQDGNWSKAILYSGFMDGHKFNDWYDERDFEIREIITHWKPIELY